MTHLAIVGGGLAGLAAGVAAIDNGAQVTLCETAPRLGGMAASFRRGALTLDTGQHVFLRGCTAYRWLLRRLGTADLAPVQPRLHIPVVAPDGRRAVIARNRLPAPLHLAPSLLRYPLLSAADRWHAAVATARLARLERGPGLDATTFGEWLAAQGQSPRAVAALWDLIALPTLNLTADAASADLAAMVFQTGLLTHNDAADLGVPAAPLGALHATPAADAIRAAGGAVHTGRRIVAIASDAGGVTLRDAAGATLRADAVVVAVPHTRVAGLLPAGTLPPHARLDRLGTVPIVNVVLHLDRRVTDLPFAAGVDTPVQYVFDRTTASGAPSGQVLAVSLSAATDAIGRRTRDLVADHHAALAALFPRAADARLRDAAVVRIPDATFRQAPGTAALRPGHATADPRIHLAGAWTDTGWPATMEGAVRSGLRAARAALDAPIASLTEAAA